MMKFVYIVSILFLFSGCDLFESQEDKAKKIEAKKVAFEKKIAESKEIQLKKLSSDIEKELAILNSKKELAKLEKEKELEKIRMQNELEKQRISLAQEKEKALFEQKMLQIEHTDNMELKRYLMLIFAIVVIISAFFLYYYFTKRREDKLHAYNDNLEKYFHQQENATKMRIAEKMLDTIASGKLDKTQESLLIGAFSNQVNMQESSPKQLENKVEEEIIDTQEEKSS